jgi:hypothetical protein
MLTMTCRRHTTTLIVAGLLWSCGGDSGPIAPGANTTAQATDPSGDTFGTGAVEWDLTALTVTRDAGGITVDLDFSSDVVSPASGDADAMIGFISFDADQDAATGFTPTIDEFRGDNGSSGVGAEFELDLANYDQNGTVAVRSATGTTGRVKPAFAGKRVTVRIPKALLGNDDGFLNAAAIVGTLGEPNDIVPEHGHLQLGGLP